jgi:hypothetical protein
LNVVSLHYLKSISAFELNSADREAEAMLYFLKDCIRSRRGHVTRLKLGIRSWQDMKRQPI